MVKFKIVLSDGDKSVEIGTGRTALWQAQDYGATLPDTESKRARTDYAWAYYAAAQAGRLAELGVPEGAGVAEAVDLIADAYDMVVDKADETAPLA